MIFVNHNLKKSNHETGTKGQCEMNTVIAKPFKLQIRYYLHNY